MICSTSLSQLPGFGINRIAAAFGVFDGLHIGHQAILDSLKSQASQADAVPVVITFDPHPEEIVNPSSPPKLLFSKEHQLFLLKKLDIGVTVLIPFTKEIANLDPEEFFDKQILVDDLKVISVCVGDNWRFGKNARGDTRLLKALGESHGFGVTTVSDVHQAGSPVSSTRVREAVLSGDLEQASNILGRRFSIMGKVEFGKGIATSSLACPTANISSKNDIFPPNGVYAARVCVIRKNGDLLYKKGVLYIGQSPTFIKSPPERPFVEIHIFDFNGEIYGQEIEVELVKYIREDRKFSSTEELRNQISKDISITKELLNSQG